MMRMGFLRRSTLVAIIILGVVSILFRYFIHPDDSRIEKFRQPNNNKSFLAKGNVKRVFRLFSKTGTFHFQPDIHSYNKILKNISKQVATHVEISSERFTHPLQFFASLGSYPNNLVGKDAILIPSNHTFYFYPGITSESAEIKFSVAAQNANSHLSVTSLDDTAETVEIKKITKAVDYKSMWYRNWLRYTDPDFDFGGGRWEEFHASLNMKKNEPVKLTCKGPGDCLVSEPQIWIADSNKKKENLIFILVDTLRYDAINPADTPTISHLAKHGVNFTHALASGNMTSPSTNSLLSCMTPSSLGEIAFSYSINRKTREHHYSKHKASFPKAFHNAGWQTTMIGNVSILSEVMGSAISHGFEHQQAIEREAYDTPQITKAAQKWLSNHGDKPFFLYLHYHAPHAPYRAPMRDIISSFPGIAVFSSYRNILKWLYRAEVQFTDRYLKALMTTVKNLGLDRTTTIVLTSDHGDHHEVRHFIDNEIGEDKTGSYFDHGATLFQDEIRVPLVISGPNFQKSSTVSHIVSHLDLAPSLLKAYNLLIPQWCEGHSIIAKTARNQNSIDRIAPLRTVGFEGFKRRGIIKSQRFKYIRQYEPLKKKVYSEKKFTNWELKFYKKELLFDLENDPGERMDLSATDPILLHKLRSEFKSYYKVKEMYELVVDNPSMKELKVKITSTHKRDKYHGNKRTVYLQDKPFSPLPIVKLGGKDISITYTKIALPLTIRLENLPLEVASSRLAHPISKVDRAYIRRVEASNSHQREITPSNPEFESILKEWGYLSDEE